MFSKELNISEAEIDKLAYDAYQFRIRCFALSYEFAARTFPEKYSIALLFEIARGTATSF